MKSLTQCPELGGVLEMSATVSASAATSLPGPSTECARLCCSTPFTRTPSRPELSSATSGNAPCPSPFYCSASFHPFLACSCLVAQSVKSLPAMWETRVQSLGREDPLEKETATHSRTLAWRTTMGGGAWWATVHGVTKSQTQLSE